MDKQQLLDGLNALSEQAEGLAGQVDALAEYAAENAKGRQVPALAQQRHQLCPACFAFFRRLHPQLPLGQ